jgi:hypothetical protein
MSMVTFDCYYSRVVYDFQLQSIGDVPIAKLKITIKEQNRKLYYTNNLFLMQNCTNQLLIIIHVPLPILYIVDLVSLETNSEG